MPRPQAVIVGAGFGLSAALTRALAPDYDVTLAARDTGKLAALLQETGAQAVPLDAAVPASMAALIENLPAAPKLCVYNPSYRVRGPITEVDPSEVRRALDVTAYGAFLMGQAAAKAMLSAAPGADGIRGTILFTGASAGVKGFAQSAAFAMGKFAQRGLAQSMARELHPQGIHVAWINIDGGIESERRPPIPGAPDTRLDPDAIAESYLTLLRQPRSAWSSELTLRPWTEPF